MASPSDLIGLVALVATASTTPCPGDAPLPVTAYTTADGHRFGVLPADAPLLDRPVAPDEAVTLFPLASNDLDDPRCEAAVTIPARRLLRPASLARVFEPAPLPTIAPVRGTLDPGSAATVRIAAVHDLATSKGSTILPTYAETREVQVPHGTTLATRFVSPAYGVTRYIYGPVLRLGATSAAAPFVEPPAIAASPLVSAEALVRRRLDERDAALQPGDRLRHREPGLGAIDVEVTSAGAIYDAGDATDRFLVAHGVAIGLPALSLSLSLLGADDCVSICAEQAFGFDERYLERFASRDAGAVRAARRRLTIFEAAGFGLAALSILVPTARRGVFDRLELLEDGLVIFEGVLVGMTTPSFLAARLPRNRPVAFHPTLAAEYEGRAAFAPPFVAFHASAVGSAWGAATTLLIVEEARWPWVLLSTLLLGGATAAVSYAEVDAGLAFPSDVAVAGIYGFLNGAGTVLWHQLFWKGWPDAPRGNLPLQIRGVRIDPAPRGGTVVSAAASF